VTSEARETGGSLGCSVVYFVSPYASMAWYPREGYISAGEGEKEDVNALDERVVGCGIGDGSERRQGIRANKVCSGM